MTTQHIDGSRDLPPVRKTEQMLEIERQHDGTDIRLIIKTIYEATGSQTEVARRLGVEQPTISVWALRLGIIFTSKPLAEIHAMPTPA